MKAGVPETVFAGRMGEVWKLNVAASPVTGKANAEIVHFLAGICHVSQSAVRIASRARKLKLIDVEGRDSSALNRVILESHGSRTDSGSAPPK